MSKRPVSPGGEELLGLYFPVLDHGFVALVDYMGTDACVERAARVSYGYGTRKTSQTRGLIRYLRRHLHTTPSEMVEFKFHCCMPMFIARQWIRHRSACLSGDAKLWFDLPNARKRGKRARLSVPIAKFFRMWHEGTRHRLVKKKPAYLERIDDARLYSIPELALLVDRREETLRNYVRDGALRARRVKQTDPRERSVFVEGRAWREFATTVDEARVDMRPRLRKMHLRSVDESTGEIIYTQVSDIWQSGTKPVFKVTLENGYSIVMSKDHRCLTENGWLTLEEATRLRLGPTHTVSWDAGAPAFATNGAPAYEDAEWLRAKRSEGRTVSEIGRWTTQIAAQVHARHGYRCVICRSKQALHAHHANPVWNAPQHARDVENLVSLCRACRDRVHADDLELSFLEALRRGESLEHFFRNKPRMLRPAEKRRRRSQRLRRQFTRIARIEYAGEQMTYDLEVVGPYHNFVANGVVVHNSVNEYSGRYSLMPMLFHTPSADQLQTQSRANNQGRSGEPVEEAKYREALRRWETIRRESQGAYEWMTGENVARELARIDLPLSTYTQWYWKIDLHNLLHFLKLRVDPHAQWEIQEYGRVMAGMLKRVAPLSFEAFIDYDVAGTRLSRMELEALRKLVAIADDGLAVRSGATLSAQDLDALGLAPREARELFAKLRGAEIPNFELDLTRARPAEEFAERFAAAVPSVDKPPTE